MGKAVLLVAHGSHFSPDSSRPVHEHRERLRKRPGFDEVRVAFWREEPALSRGLDGFALNDIIVVPVLISAGYFVGEVVPRELGLAGRVSRIDGKTVRYADPVGSHPALAPVILKRGEEAGASPADVLVVLGHGTRRNRQSEHNVYSQAERVATLVPGRDVRVAFLEQEPTVTEVVSDLEGAAVTLVPLFIADGWHVGTTVREDLGLDELESTAPGGRRIRLAPAVGTHPLVTSVIAEMAEDAAQW